MYGMSFIWNKNLYVMWDIIIQAIEANVIIQTKGLFSSTLLEIVSGQCLQFYIADSHVFIILVFSNYQMGYHIPQIIKAKEEF